MAFQPGSFFQPEPPSPERSWLRNGLRWLLRTLGRRPYVSPDHSEDARQRAGREYHALVTNTIRFAVWLALWAVVGGAVGVWLGWGHTKGATVAITTAAALIGIGAGFGLPCCWLWLTAPVAQRNEGRSQMETDRAQYAERRRAEE